MGGTTNRMKSFAEYIMKEIGHELPTGCQLVDIAASANRYVMYKVLFDWICHLFSGQSLNLLIQVGPVLSVSHGLGMSSISVLLHEMIKLVSYAKCKDPIFIRFGTCGGVGIEGGTVVVSNGAFNGLLQAEHNLVKRLFIFFITFLIAISRYLSGKSFPDLQNSIKLWLKK